MLLDGLSAGHRRCGPFFLVCSQSAPHKGMLPGSLEYPDFAHRTVRWRLSCSELSFPTVGLSLSLYHAYTHSFVHISDDKCCPSNAAIFNCPDSNNEEMYFWASQKVLKQTYRTFNEENGWIQCSSKVVWLSWSYLMVGNGSVPINHVLNECMEWIPPPITPWKNCFWVAEEAEWDTTRRATKHLERKKVVSL